MCGARLYRNNDKLDLSKRSGTRTPDILNLISIRWDENIKELRTLLRGRNGLVALNAAYSEWKSSALFKIKIRFIGIPTSHQRWGHGRRDPPYWLTSRLNCTIEKRNTMLMSITVNFGFQLHRYKPETEIRVNAVAINGNFAPFPWG